MKRCAPLSIRSMAIALAAYGCTHAWVVAGPGPAPKVSARSVDTAQQFIVALQRPAYVFAYAWDGGRLRPAYAADTALAAHVPATLHRFGSRPVPPVASALPTAEPARRLVYYCPGGFLNERGVEAQGKGCGWFLWPEGERLAPSLEPGRALSQTPAASEARIPSMFLVVAEQDIAPAALEGAAQSVDARGDATTVGRALAHHLFGQADASSGTVVYVSFP